MTSLQSDIQAVRKAIAEKVDGNGEDARIGYAIVGRILTELERLQAENEKLKLVLQFPQSKKEAILVKALEFYATKDSEPSLVGHLIFRKELGLAARAALEKVRRG